MTNQSTHRVTMNQFGGYASAICRCGWSRGPIGVAPARKAASAHLIDPGGEQARNDREALELTRAKQRVGHAGAVS